MASSRKPRARILVAEDDRALNRAVSRILVRAGYRVTSTFDGAEAAQALQRSGFELLLLDLVMPRRDGMEVLRLARELEPAPRAVVMTADDTPATILQAIRNQASEYLVKPFPPAAITEVVERVLETPAEALPIELVSARPEWVELLVPCALEAAERIQGFIMKLDGALSGDDRESVGQAFRELLLNAIEWGGQLDPSRRVRITFIRARRMLLYRIADPGQGFRLEGLAHAAISNPAGDPVGHARVRQQKGLRPGGFGILMVRALVDELIYNEARNEVLLIKYLD